MKPFPGLISKPEIISMIDEVVHDEQFSSTLAELFLKIRTFDLENSKPYYMRSPEEKKEFLGKIRATEEFNLAKERPDIVKKLVKHHFFEFLLPYVMITHDIDGYKNFELVGIGYYESNREILCE